MSLINEALKKVQSQAPGSPLSGPASGAPLPPPAEQAKIRGWLTLVLSTMVLILLCALILILVSAAWKGDDPEVVIASQTTTLPHSGPMPFGDSAPELTPLVYRSVEEIEGVEKLPEEPGEIKPLVDDSPPREVTVIVQQTRPTPPVGTSTSSPARSVAVEEVIDALDIRGVMSSGQRLLIHNNESGRTQAYQAGSIIDEALKLRILKVEDRLITFTTDDGQIYTRKF